MQPCKTGDQLYSDASPYSKCSLPNVSIRPFHVGVDRPDKALAPNPKNKARVRNLKIISQLVIKMNKGLSRTRLDQR